MRALAVRAELSSLEEKFTAVTIERDSLRENFVRAVERNERLRAALEEIINYMETPDYVREIARRALEGDGCENSTVATMK
jgi:predicted nuclease with TOPRIM domain